MLFYSGNTFAVGDVDRGNTRTDYMDIERDRGITINSAAVTLKWDDHYINVIDTPGHVDFTVEVERAIRVLDGGVVILDGVVGVQAQTVTVINQAKRYGIPLVAYANKMDKIGASLTKVSHSLKNKLDMESYVVHMPLGKDRSFNSVVDLITMEVLEWSNDNFGYNMTRSQIKDEKVLKMAQQERNALIEQIAIEDEKMLENYFAGEEIDSVQIMTLLKKLTLQRKGVILMCGSSLKNKGVHPILDSIINYLPSPFEKSPPIGIDSHGKESEILCDPKDKLVALAFKVVHDMKLGLVVYFRVYRGILKKGVKVYNSNSNEDERPLRVVRIEGEEMDDFPEVPPGNIGAAIGLKHTTTGDTLVESNKDIIKLEGMNVPDPVFFCSVLPEGNKGEDDLLEALKYMSLEDPSFKFEINKDTHQIVIGGMGELHLETVLHRLKNHYKISCNHGEIYISYKSKITEETEDTVENSYTTDTVESGSATIKITPLETDSENITELLYDSSELPPSNARLYKEMCLSAIDNAIKNGVPSGYPLIDIKVQVLNIDFQNVKSPAVMRNIVYQAVLKLAKESEPIIVEPVMKLELTSDKEYTRAITDDIISRKDGRVENVHGDDRVQTIDAVVPLRNLVGYSSYVRSISKGTSSWSMVFEGHQPLSPSLTEELLLKGTL
eukprot:TRINITY_DN11645_c0_g1_i2.p1 TRINITY_DN11645_c0_g1~~TRINITY_DN11645_c0_g1_i2.p1  ORF type:complete len:668 (+),score=161.30 TRINITY_DN11645_c0_g1_i2:195-2198(+)